MNAAELARNKQLSDFFVRNLNAGPDNWALPDQCLDAVVCCVSIQYMQVNTFDRLCTTCRHYTLYPLRDTHCTHYRTRTAGYMPKLRTPLPAHSSHAIENAKTLEQCQHRKIHVRYTSTYHGLNNICII